MATKTDMIKFITTNSDKKEEELSGLNYKSVKKIFDKTEEPKIHPLNKDFEENEFGNGEEGVTLFKREVEKPIVKEVLDVEKVLTEIVKEEIKEKSVTPKKKPVEKKIDMKSLSTSQMRAYARTGKIPKLKNNRYTRFDTEKPARDF